jgi:hypothetical protein
MTTLQLVDHIELDWHSAPWKAPPVQLKCPACSAEFDRPVPMAFDARLQCTACGAMSEFRQFHETWCLGIRAELALNCPDLLWLMGTEILAPLSSADAIQGDRRTRVPQTASVPVAAIHLGAEEFEGDEVDAGRPARKSRKPDRP